MKFDAMYVHQPYVCDQNQIDVYICMTCTLWVALLLVFACILPTFHFSTLIFQEWSYFVKNPEFAKNFVEDMILDFLNKDIIPDFLSDVTQNWQNHELVC